MELRDEVHMSKDTSALEHHGKCMKMKMMMMIIIIIIINISA
jgi:hypothetical protein